MTGGPAALSPSLEHALLMPQFEDRSHTTTLSVRYCAPERAATVAAAVRPEIDEIADDRSTASLECDGQTVTVTVAADDLTALRAGCTTWTALLAVASDVAGGPDGWTAED